MFWIICFVVSSMSQDMRETTRYKAWWTDKWMWGTPQLQELWTWVDCSIRLKIHTSSKLRNPQPWYDNEYISSSEALRFFKAPHNSYCPHLLQACLQFLLVAGCKLHIPILLQTFLFNSFKGFGENFIKVKELAFRVFLEKLFISFQDPPLAWVLSPRHWWGFSWMT